jgi:hypothetical protein
LEDLDDIDTALSNNKNKKGKPSNLKGNQVADEDLDGLWGAKKSTFVKT